MTFYNDNVLTNIQKNAFNTFQSHVPCFKAQAL